MQNYFLLVFLVYLFDIDVLQANVSDAAGELCRRRV